jgi:hypothetical protein
MHSDPAIARPAGVTEGTAGVIRSLAHAAVDPSQGRLGTHANGQEDQAGVDVGAGLGPHLDSTSDRLERGCPIAQAQVHTMSPKLFVEGMGHLGIEGRHDLWTELEESHGESLVNQVLGHL